MRMIGTKQRASIGGWLLAAMILVSVNIYPLMSMEDKPLVGYSHTIKSLKVRLSQFENNLTDGLFSLGGPVESPEPTAQPADAEPTETNAALPAAIQNSPQHQAPPAVLLPSLSGVMQVVDPNGAVYYQAVLNGKVCRTKDVIDNFTIAKITKTGVVVRRMGRKWTIESPTPYYSSDRGN